MPYYSLPFVQLLSFDLRDRASHPNLDLSNMLSDHNHYA